MSGAILSKLLVDRGSDVTAGQLLAEVDTAALARSRTVEAKASGGSARLSFFIHRSKKKSTEPKSVRFQSPEKKLVRNRFLFNLKKFDRPFFSGKFVQVKVSTVRDFQFAFHLQFVA